MGAKLKSATDGRGILGHFSDVNDREIERVPVCATD